MKVENSRKRPKVAFLLLTSILLATCLLLAILPPGQALFYRIVLTTAPTKRRLWAVRKLGKLGGAGLEPLTLALGDKTEKVRVAAAEVLSEDYKVHSLPIKDAMIRALEQDPSAEVRKWMASCLGYVGRQDLSVIPHLINACKDDHAVVREWAIYNLGYIGPKAAAALPILDEIATKDKYLASTAKLAASYIRSGPDLRPTSSNE